MENNLGICPSDLGQLIKLIKAFLLLLKIIVPIGIILKGCLDFVRVVAGNPDKDMPQAKKIFFNRLLAGAMVFLLFYIITFSINLIASDNNSNSDWKTCWENVEVSD